MQRKSPRAASTHISLPTYHLSVLTRVTKNIRILKKLIKEEKARIRSRPLTVVTLLQCTVPSHAYVHQSSSIPSLKY